MAFVGGSIGTAVVKAGCWGHAWSVPGTACVPGGERVRGSERESRRNKGVTYIRPGRLAYILQSVM